MTVRETNTRVPTTSGDRTATIAALNDDLRCRARGGTLCATAGIIALGNAALPAILAAVRGYSQFSPENDPYGEHDFGAFTWCNHRIFWKIDCYDRDLRFGSPDPTDPSVTTRVLTIMLAGEW